MEITVRSQEDANSCAVIKIDGRVDATNSEQIGDVFDVLIAQGLLKFLVDVSQINYINTSGLRELVTLQKWCRKNNGELKLVVTTKSKVDEVIQMTGLGKFFSIFANEVAAAASLGLVNVNQK